MENLNQPTLYGLMDKVLSDTSISNQDKIKLIDELRKNNPNSSDRWAPRVATWILGAVVITALICITLGTGKNNEGLIAIGSAAVGGLAGLIVQNSGAGSDKNQSTTI